MNIILSIKRAFFNLFKKPLHKMKVEEVMTRFNTTFAKRKQQVESERSTIKQLFSLQKQEFTMRLEKASTDYHLKGMLALVTNMKKNWMFWNEGKRICKECEKSLSTTQHFLSSHADLFHQKHLIALATHQDYATTFQELKKSNELTQKHLAYLQADAEFIKKDLIKRAKELLESEAARGMSFEELFKQKKQWIRDEVVDLLRATE